MARRSKAEIMAGVHSADGGRVVANNTVIYSRPDGARVVRLHLTDIVVFHESGRVTLDHGGWPTVTTKDRMNRALDSEFTPIYWPGAWSWGVCSGDGRPFGGKSGIWYLWKRNADPDCYSGPWHPFLDRLTFDPVTGKVNGGNGAKLQELEEAKGRIREFCERMADLESLPMPDAGDCLFCQVYPTSGHKPGEESGSWDHVRSHVEEGYIHGSLIVRAMRWAGYRDEGIGMYLHGFGSRGRSRRDRLQSAPVRAVRRYLYRAYGLAGGQF